MEEDTEQTGQGGMQDDLMGRGRDAASQAMNDPANRDRAAGMAEERFGNVPGMDQAAQAFRGMGGSGSDQESSAGYDSGGESTGEYDTGGDTSSMEDTGMDESGSSRY